MSRKGQTEFANSQGELTVLNPALGTAPCVPGIKAEVDRWVKSGYLEPAGCTETSKALLNYWFHSDHRLADGQGFVYHHAQKEAMESLVYLFEVAKIKRQKAMLERYALETRYIQLLQHDDFARYSFKMATGSGKTKVMSLAIAWQYFNAILENAPGYSKTFLLIAPNVIVFERLRLDFADGRIFRIDPIVPPEFANMWDLETYMRGEGERTSSEGALYLANIQQLYGTAPADDGNEPRPITDVLGPKPQVNQSQREDFLPRLINRKDSVVVINDEAHHTHDEDLKWNDFIRELNSKANGGVGAQLDFSATPRFANGSLFSGILTIIP